MYATHFLEIATADVDHVLFGLLRFPRKDIDFVLNHGSFDSLESDASSLFSCVEFRGTIGIERLVKEVSNFTRGYAPVENLDKALHAKLKGRRRQSEIPTLLQTC